ncbi:MAG: hypothetical protein Fur0022_17050 [Anaerolineales bacterium]
MSEPLRFNDYKEVLFIGVDTTFGRFGEVTVLQCLRCAQYWLKYFVQYEHRRASGRWYMGLLSPDDIDTLTPENAPAYLQSLDWLHFGGSYFGFTGKRARTSLHLD